MLKKVCDLCDPGIFRACPSLASVLSSRLYRSCQAPEDRGSGLPD